MDGRLKAAITTYLVREGVKPSRLGNIISVEMEPFHCRTWDDCDIESYCKIYYDEWTSDMTHSRLTYHELDQESFEGFLEHIANYRQES